MERVLWLLGGKLLCDGRNALRRYQWSAAWKDLFEYYRCAFTSAGSDLELVHEPARACDSQAHARFGTVTSLEDSVQVADPWSAVRDADQKKLRSRLTLYDEFHAASAGVVESISRDFRHRRGNASLILGIKAE